MRGLSRLLSHGPTLRFKHSIKRLTQIVENRNVYQLIKSGTVNLIP